MTFTLSPDPAMPAVTVNVPAFVLATRCGAIAFPFALVTTVACLLPSGKSALALLPDRTVKATLTPRIGLPRLSRTEALRGAWKRVSTTVP